MTEVFIPELKPLYRLISLTSIVTLAGIAFFILGYKSKFGRLNPLATMGGGLLTVFGLVTTIVLYWNLVRTPTIAVSENFILIGRDTLYTTQIDKVYLQQTGQTNLMRQTENHLIGIIKTKDGKQYLYSDQDYDIKKMIGTIKKTLK